MPGVHGTGRERMPCRVLPSGAELVAETLDGRPENRRKALNMLISRPGIRAKRLPRRARLMHPHPIGGRFALHVLGAVAGGHLEFGSGDEVRGAPRPPPRRK